MKTYRLLYLMEWVKFQGWKFLPAADFGQENIDKKDKGLLKSRK